MISSNNEYYSWFDNSDGDRLTLETFKHVLLPHIAPLVETRISLQEVRDLFSPHEPVFPFQRRRATMILAHLISQLQVFKRSLKDSSSLPFIILALRYRLLDEIYFLEERTDQLISFINTLPASQPTARERQKIQELFTLVLECIDNIPEKTRSLLDEARFHERRLDAIS